jgi:hypothetical protein
VPQFPDLPWWQVHIRGYRHDDPSGLELTAHFEAEPAEHPEEHLEHLGIDVARGNAVLRRILDEAGVEYTLSPDWPADADDGDASPEESEGVDVHVE